VTWRRKAWGSIPVQVDKSAAHATNSRVAFRLWLALLAATACAGTESTLITTLSDAGTDASTPAGGSGSSKPVPPGTSWQIQLSGALDDSYDVDLYDVDLHNNSEADFAELHASGRFVACYFSAGTLEAWREDADAVPDSVIGNPHPAYPSESWLDVRDGAVREVMEARIELARAKGCDAIQPANLALSAFDSGFAIGESETIAYAEFLANAAHTRGMQVAWSDEPGLLSGIEQLFDWGIAIQCIEFDSCAPWLGFADAGKPVFMVEIGDEADIDRLCPAAASLGFPLVIKDSNYTAFRVGCP
jgi:hypothetical protein